MPTAYIIGAKLGGSAASNAGGHSPSPQGENGQNYFLYAPDQAKGFRIGSGNVLELPPNSEIGYLEISGSGLSSIHQTIADKKEDLRAIGARLTQDQFKYQAETAQTARIKAESDASLLNLIANTTDQLLTEVLKLSARFMRREENVSVMLDRTVLTEMPAPSPNTNIDDWPIA